MVPAKATWSDLYQRVPVPTGTTCVASIWVKGTGAVQLQVWANSTWTNLLAQVRCTGTANWTKYTTGEFKSGSRTRVWISMDDSISNAAGTLFLDDVFLGPVGGTNRVLNPDFESGNVDWTRPSGTVFEILQNP